MVSSIFIRLSLQMLRKISLLILPLAAFGFPPRSSDPFSPLGPWSRRGPPCGLPRFIDKVPEKEAEQIRQIWASYKEGDDCDAQHKQTREIIRSLPDDVRDKIFAGRCGPSFLRSVSSTVRKEFRSVWFDHRLSLEQKELALKKLAYSLLTGESLAMFNKWEEELQIRKTELTKKIAALTPAAKEAYENWKELRLKEKQFLANLPKEVREELRSLCGYRKTKDDNSNATTPSEEVTTEATTTEVSQVSTTTPQPLVEESRKEKEFSLFLDVSMPEDFNDEAQCSYYV
ncbi:hypothetical protein WR25_02834 [Diploscapter pachys]|uniref:SXP/RAL-2 family protein Ani s 5-like cation-binding domain-containing protein n=1 Tax=Diploscapter pachys TaxID=2018661 RepID=A0A2A2K1X6_9BILA|nr:hypothetical protein WR25_02834 [Diploscapter pachys]